jgi:hypothetical protein
MEYEKNDATIYDEIKNKQEIAITNAKKLLDINKGKNPFDSNPSTTVHELVELLNKYIS